MGYNMKHAGVKRLMREAIEMKEPTDLYYAQPIDDENLFEWHFTVSHSCLTDYSSFCNLFFKSRVGSRSCSFDKMPQTIVYSQTE